MITCEQTADAISAVYGIEKERWMTRDSHRPMPECRHMYSWICKQSGYTLSSIARTMGRKHETVISSIRTAENMYMGDASFKRNYEEVMAALQYVTEPRDAIRMSVVLFEKILSSMREVCGSMEDLIKILKGA